VRAYRPRRASKRCVGHTDLEHLSLLKQTHKASRWGGMPPASWRPSRERARWLDLPEHIRKHVISRAEED
jgi:hypothetical protein